MALREAYDKIISMDEYWVDDGMAPQWRLKTYWSSNFMNKKKIYNL
ncbi:hypothetical protein [Longibaculum muris]|nr:hypothetical protein [Longibaculum muris]KXU52021.1 hypothetical protein HMPREF3037_00516 [Candidatus Stoquefichus sp. KLE1796]MBS5370603.1 hypothetical protein [Coprobacillus cateniformis]MCR1889160.1 hypothetical protein [Longibaculum muris]